MPKLTLESAGGPKVRLDTLDPAKIGPWLAEWLPRLADPGDGGNAPLLLLYVVPIWDPATDRLDWPPGTAPVTLDTAGREQLLRAFRDILFDETPCLCGNPHNCSRRR